MNAPRTNTHLFLTVLATCLGLLVIGVPVQVFAQHPVATNKSKLTKEAKCSDEASSEVEDLLNHGAFIRPLTEFVADVGKLISIDKYDLKDRAFIEVIVEIPQDGTIGIGGSSSGNGWLKVAAENAAEKISEDFGDGEKVYQYDSKWKNPVERFVITFLFEDSSLVVKAKAENQSPGQAQKLAATYNSYFSLGSCRERGEPEEIFYKNSKALVENNQVLIVTHLARAALSDLLAKPLAAN